jgi:hypothetical protein
MATAARRRPLAADLVVPVLDSVAEGSWIALVYVTVQVALAHAPAALGPLSFAIAAGLGLAWSRAARGRLAGTGAFVLLVLVAGLVGWLADPDVRAALDAAVRSGGYHAVEMAVTTNAAGWLLGLAVVRGASHGARARDEERTGRLLGRILLLAVPWAVGLAFAGDDRPSFIAQATLCTLLFAGAGLLAVGLGRLETYGAASGVDWRQNRSWVTVVAIVVALMLAVSLPAAFLVGAPPLAIVDAAWVSLAAVVGLFGAVVGTVGAPLLAGFEALMNALPTPQPTPLPPASAPPAGLGEVAPVQGDPRIGLTLTILVLVAISIILVAIVARIRTGSRRATRMAAGPSPVEERSIERPRLRMSLPAVRLPRPRRSPATAPDAYLALLDDLDDDTALARGPSETPRVHAARLGGRRLPGQGPDRSVAATPELPARSAAPEVDVDMLAADWTFGGRGGRGHLGDLAVAERAAHAARRTAASGGRGGGAAARPPAADPHTRRDLGLLVADWELARYAGRALTPAEDARGIARWRRLRMTLRRGPVTRDRPG